jgi:large subunit ribosomal protein L5
MARLLDQYNQTIAPDLCTKFALPQTKAGKPNPMAIPRLEKIVINMGVGRATQDKAVLEAAVDVLSRISGQKPVITKAKVSVASFRLREGNEIGCKVTLRGKRMYEFLDRLITISLPRIRDFRGVNPNSFDGNGNYTLGLSEQVVFPEIDADKITHTIGMDITVVTSTQSDDQARELLRQLGVPFRQAQKDQHGGPAAK